MILSKRLTAAASFVERGSTVADIGTDHAYLPVYLLENGTAVFAYATDINTQPLERAKTNIEKCGFLSKTAFVLTDGLSGMDKYTFDTAAICGMGGDTIVEILDDAPFVKERKIKLILQPMSAVERLRKYLAGNGFVISDESLCCDAGKYYFTLSVIAGDATDEYDVYACYLGKFFEAHLSDEVYLNYLKLLRAKLTAIINGREAGKVACIDEKTVLCHIETLLCKR